VVESLEIKKRAEKTYSVVDEMTQNQKKLTFKVLGILLSYPKQEMINDLDDFQSIIEKEGLLSKKQLNSLEKLTTFLKKTDLYELQETYVNIFDRKRTLSLHPLYQFFRHQLMLSQPW